MGTLSKLALFLVFLSAAIIFIRHSSLALRPALPGNMPAQSSFLQTGFNLQVNEPEGEWVACGQDAEQNTNFCRVSDARGIIVYQGDFLPLRAQGPLPTDQLEVATLRDAKFWVKSPSQAAPIPVIPLRNGQVLVPAGDREALVDRWATHSEEFQSIASGQ